MNQPRELEQEYQPENFRRYQYQQDAVLTAKRIVEEYNGVFLADVVGLGKTYMAAMLARELDGGILVIAPPALIDEANPGAWGNVFRDFGVRRYKTFSVGKLDSILKLDLSKFQYVFIDEPHRFRNEDNETYAKLHRICRNKKVVLVTATPFNNRPNDANIFWKVICDKKHKLGMSESVICRVDTVVRSILNPLSHAANIPMTNADLMTAKGIIEDLEKELKRLKTKLSPKDFSS